MPQKFGAYFIRNRDKMTAALQRCEGAPPNLLTKRQLEAITFRLAGRSLDEIADEMGKISKQAVNQHIKRAIQRHELFCGGR